MHILYKNHEMIIVVSIDISLVGGFNPTPLKNHGVKVSWDDDIPNWMESHNPAMFQSPPTRYIVIPIINHRLTID